MIYTSNSSGGVLRRASRRSNGCLVRVIWGSLVTSCLCLDTRIEEAKRSTQCGLYMAESTIAGSGMGMFVGHTTFETGELIADSDATIPLFELDWHNGNLPFRFLWDDYAWLAGSCDELKQEVDNVDDVFLARPGFGAVPNCKFNMINAAMTKDTHSMGTSGVSSDSPGAGAFSPFHGLKFHAQSTLSHGMELFVGYGEDYFVKRRDKEYAAKVPILESFRIADELLQKFLSLKRAILPALRIATNTSLFEELYTLMVQEMPYKSRTMYAMPPPDTHLSDVEHILETGGTFNVGRAESIRSLEWLEEHGTCIDNIKPGDSTVPNAGRGAFAARFIPHGGLVMPMPLIHENRDVLTMYKPKLVANEGDGRLTRERDQPSHHQLMLNYCFSHRDVTFVLCPYGLFNPLINHSKDQPNAKLQWSDHMRHPEWLNQPYYSWDTTGHPGLSFDVVALRDIVEGEEILIDYGLEWETAWQKHYNGFRAPRRGYLPSFELNKLADLQVMTIFEANNESMDGILTYCRKDMINVALGRKLDTELNFLEAVELDGGERLYRCRVVHRNHNDSYIAELITHDKEPQPPGTTSTIAEAKVAYVLFDVPRDIFYFRDAPYSRDHHQEWSFRHYMGIPDEMVPDVWRRTATNSMNRTNAFVANTTRDEVPEQDTKTNVADFQIQEAILGDALNVACDEVKGGTDSQPATTSCLESNRVPLIVSLPTVA